MGKEKDRHACEPSRLDSVIPGEPPGGKSHHMGPEAEAHQVDVPGERDAVPRQRRRQVGHLATHQLGIGHRLHVAWQPGTPAPVHHHHVAVFLETA